MFKALKKLFSKPAPTQQDAKPGDDSIDPNESLEDLYREFCATFCVAPGVTLMARVRARGNHPLRDWLRWDTNRPEPKAIIRLGVSAFRDGLKVWDRQLLEMFIRGEPEDDGGPSEESVLALSWFCKETGSPITIFWESFKSGEMKYTEIKPTEE